MFLGNPKDSVWEDWGSPYREDERNEESPPLKFNKNLAPFSSHEAWKTRISGHLFKGHRVTFVRGEVTFVRGELSNFRWVPPEISKVKARTGCLCSRNL